MPDSSAKRQSTNAGSGNDSTGRRHPERMRCVIDITPCAAAANGYSARRRIDPRIFYRAQIDDQPIVANSQTSRVMSTAADRDKQIILFRKVYGVNDVSHICTTGDEPRLFIYHPVVHLAGFIVIFVARVDQSPAQVGFQMGNSILVKHDEVSAKRSYGQDSERLSIFIEILTAVTLIYLPIEVGDV